MASPLLFLGALILASPAALAAPTEVTLLAVLPEHNLRYPGAWPRVAPALDLALEALEPELRSAGLSVRIVFASSEENGNCSLSLAEQNVAKLMASQAPDVLLGFGCVPKTVRREGPASRWGLPVLSAGEYQWYFNDFTTVYGGPEGPSSSVIWDKLQQRFNWTSPIFASRRKGPGEPEYFFGIRFQGALDEQPAEALQFLQTHGRAAFFEASPETIQHVMHLAQARSMTNGDYVFIYLDVLGESLEAVGHREAAKPWQSKDGRDVGGLREAFQTVLIITAHQPQTPEYRRFQNELILRAQRDFGVALNDTRHKNLVASCFHDALLLYIRALKETLREGGTKQDTRSILEKMKGLKIEGVTGTVSIDNDRNREMDYDLWSMADVESGQFQVVAHYVGSEARIKWLKPIHWKNGCPPLNDPPCVFN